MLVLSRREGESIRIGDDIELVVTGIQGNRVKLGVRAPRHIPVHRKELLEQLNEAAELRSPSTASLPNSSTPTSLNSPDEEAQSCQPYSNHRTATMRV